jgi:hypothetical protein
VYACVMEYEPQPNRNRIVRYTVDAEPAGRPPRPAGRRPRRRSSSGRAARTTSAGAWRSGPTGCSTSRPATGTGTPTGTRPARTCAT